MPDQRRFSRIAFDAHCTVSSGAAAREARLLDISMKGVLIELPREWHPRREDKVEVTVKLNGGDVRIRMDAIVSHIEGDRLGLRCVSIDLDSVSHLRRLIELNMGEPDMIDRELAALI